jgi:hypothetical protein
MRRATLVAVVSGLAFWVNGGPATAGASETQTISYGGYEIVVPASWPVYRLDQDPHQCVRYDVSALYLGTPGADQQCPPGLLGRTETVSIQIPASRPAVAGGEMIRSLPGSAAVTANPAAHQFAVAMSGVEVSATYGSDPGVVQRVLDSLRPVSGAQAGAAEGSSADTAKGSTAGAAKRSPAGKAKRSTAGKAKRPSAGKAKGFRSPGATTQAATTQYPATQYPTAQGPETQWPPAQWTPTQWPPAPEPGAQWPPAQEPADQWFPAQYPTAPSSPAPSQTTSGRGTVAAGGDPPAVRQNHADKPTQSASAITATSKKQPEISPPNGTSGFDTCTAPSMQAMTAWHKKYGVAGIYIGGSNMACDYGNLNPSWVQAVTKMGWGLLPVYVGPQAPCYGAGDMINAKQAASQGQSAAGDAVTQAAALGLPSDSPIYYDMEGFDETNAGCMTAVLKFLDAWTKTLNGRGYTSGVYSSVDSGVQDLQSAAAKHSIAEPQAIWFALWDGHRSLGSSSTFGDAPWPVQSRTKQYAGPHSQTIGGITLNIDSDLWGGPLADNSSG